MAGAGGLGKPVGARRPARQRVLPLACAGQLEREHAQEPEVGSREGR